ncbi:hypothetical protein SLEP1_g59040 [Rubroshorea leprosula]|uniref:SAM domain-containing protein n=1 Tax=Rubroshorea leprosula TaxID=152421 RepID=A0AAV5MR59_9ROSI|nr:hypothetical protein SLEP1_g59040 [Rubroshorea leprosula]
MAEASRGKVTITLGRGSTSKVVKRAADIPDDDFFDSRPVSGSKRSVRDRLGSNVDSSLLHASQVNNKRQRGDGYGANGVDDVHIGKDDLRLKLMRKNGFRQAQSDDNQDMDLREKLSRVGRPLLNNSYDTQKRMPELRENSILARFPSSRNADVLPQMDSSRSSYSPWTLDHLRRRSPDKVMCASQGLSPPRNVEELQRRPINRTYDDVRAVRAVPYMSKDVLEAPRSVGASPFVTKPTMPNAPLKPAPPGPPLLNQILPPSSIVPKPPYPGEEQQTVDGFLHLLGLEKYAHKFNSEEVDMTALRQMGENDLKELGIPMGPRKKILLALLPRTKRPQP